MELGKELVAASATPLVLAILAEGESYGYGIIKRVTERQQWQVVDTTLRHIWLKARTA
jgi:DNA-binding PadR family transcriptional regulator